MLIVVVCHNQRDRSRSSLFVVCCSLFVAFACRSLSLVACELLLLWCGVADYCYCCGLSLLLVVVCCWSVLFVVVGVVAFFMSVFVVDVSG